MNNTIDPSVLPQPHVRLIDGIHNSALTDPQRLHLDGLMDAVLDDTVRRRKVLALVQECISDLRMGLKYVQFDLEATTRERDEYKRRLEL